MRPTEAEAAAEAAGGPVVAGGLFTEYQDTPWILNPGTEDFAAALGMPPLPAKQIKVQHRGMSLKAGTPLSPTQSCWFDVRVLYVRISACPVDDEITPETLLCRFPPRDISCSLEVNGARISPSEEVCLTIRRDRVDCDSAEATYVSTDRLRASGSVGFEVAHEEEQLMCGTLQRHEHMLGDVGTEGDDGGQTHSVRLGWSLECQCMVGSAGCVFLRGKHDFSTLLVPPSMEVCIVGKFNGAPVILTQTVLLTARRRIVRKVALDAIPEADEADRLGTSAARAPVMDDGVEGAQQSLAGVEAGAIDKPRYAGGGVYDLPLAELGGYGMTAYGEGEESEMSWFNAGVRVGVGLGLGMCLGIGIGVGIIMRSYQAATRSFRRGVF